MDRNASAKQRGAVFAGLTGTKAPSADGSADMRSMITSVYGKNARGGPNTAKAAKSLGVSQRTVQRWLKGTNKPKPATFKKITRRNRQRMTTKRGRSSLAAQMKKSMGKAKHFDINVHGVQGPTPDPKNYSYLRHGNANSELSPEEYEKLLDAWAERGDQGALEFLQNHYSDNYVDDWHFHGVDGIRVNPRMS